MAETDLFHALVALLKPDAAKMHVKAATDTNYYLEETTSSNKPQMFGAVQVKKSYSSFHLFPVYTHPHLLENISPELRKRMQGKSCFNFKTQDDVLFAELEGLIRLSHDHL